MPAAAAAQSMKSPEAFRTISEVASELDVPQHVLRFWETKFTQVRPVKRAGGSVRPSSVTYFAPCSRSSFCTPLIV